MILAVDTSAVVAFLEGEDDALAIARCLAAARQKLMSAGTYLECGVVVGSHLGHTGIDRLAVFLRDARIELAPLWPEEAAIGIHAYRRFGKGSGHPARLNFGDCFSYALAKARNLPLLFKGDDFSRTDIVPALARG